FRPGSVRAEADRPDVDLHRVVAGDAVRDVQVGLPRARVAEPRATADVVEGSRGSRGYAPPATDRRLADRALHADLAYGALGDVHEFLDDLQPVDAGNPLRSLCTLGSLRTLGPLGSLGSGLALGAGGAGLGELLAQAGGEVAGLDGVLGDVAGLHGLGGDVLGLDRVLLDLLAAHQQ